MAQSKMPRRPAMLDAARADAIIGDEDPAASAAVAKSVPLKNVRLLIAMSASRFADTLIRPYYPLYA